MRRYRSFRSYDNNNARNEGSCKLSQTRGLNAKIMIGGAVVNADYAKEIGADGYSEDAYGAVKLASKLAGI